MHIAVILGSIGAVLLTAVLVIDYIGVRVIDDNGLGFNIHIYFFALTFWLSSAVFSFALYRLDLSIIKSIFFGFILGGVWWL